jgi:hypothetical protein
VHLRDRAGAKQLANFEVAQEDGLEPEQTLALEVIRGPDREPGAGVPTVLQSTCTQAVGRSPKGSAATRPSVRAPEEFGRHPNDRAEERVL